MSIIGNNNSMTTCASCGKSGDDIKTCTACKQVKYCSVACQKAHRPIHKRECKKRAAELFDEALFREPPPREECHICFLPLPLNGAQVIYQSCCGKTLCHGCTYGCGSICPFCRTPELTSLEEAFVRLKKRIELNDAGAFYTLGCKHRDGTISLL